MKKLWNYEDYVNHLSHENRLVRRWAFEALKEHFPNRYTDEISSLLNDEDEMLTNAAQKYLADHNAVQHAPAILENFNNRRGLIPGNAARMLAKMKYEPAVDVILERISSTGNEDTLIGILYYLGNIHLETCRNALISAVSQLKDTFNLGTAMAALLQHHHPEDVHTVLGTYFESGNRKINPQDMFLKNISASLGGWSYFDGLTEFGRSNILENPTEVLDDFADIHPQIELDEILRKNMITYLEKGQYEDFVTMIMFDARKIVNSRYPDNNCHDCLIELFGRDTMCIRLLEDISKRTAVWDHIYLSDEFGNDFISFIISIYFAVKERGAYLKALHPGAGIEELMFALKNSGSELPLPIRDKITALSLVPELKAALTKDLLTWGDSWVVHIMGRIGSKDFIPDLIRILRDSDSMNYIHGDAIEALDALDESADEIILSTIKNKELGDWESFPLLTHLPYPEAYDIAVEIWENENDDGMDSHEMFASCLRGIGDPRGIKKLQDLHAHENDSVSIGNPLECLAKIHNKDIPELPSILVKRKKQREKQTVWAKEMEQMAKDIQDIENRILPENQLLPEKSNNIIPFKRKTPKVGRNAPCPCGSGKKYKKCCLNKNN